ncbi:hypothetical protein AMAG_18263 [Allomyces macrogynus ATCC 38327]|uniref:Uncharacterized protein n=1 Tax=Allomyces macrogynus (strain ATCC 38327) TaxID=578462 RepID=A0A0L0S7W9_ALLM3|nr:hypothetical protein AMAG_18263 [Allomyces macrogynus ATCC 38327]|eukprot:KNE58516.1 hypothetical protein AMAG_18263 [Allomyces macrogynus ATCC 38327]
MKRHCMPASTTFPSRCSDPFRRFFLRRVRLVATNPFLTYSGHGGLQLMHVSAIQPIANPAWIYELSRSIRTPSTLTSVDLLLSTAAFSGDLARGCAAIFTPPLHISLLKIHLRGNDYSDAAGLSQSMRLLLSSLPPQLKELDLDFSSVALKVTLPLPPHEWSPTVSCSLQILRLFGSAFNVLAPTLFLVLREKKAKLHELKLVNVKVDLAWEDLRALLLRSFRHAHLENNNDSASGIPGLIQHFSAVCPGLRTLVVKRNNLNSAFTMALRQLLAAPSKLETLNADWTQLSATESRSMAEVLPSLRTSLQTLHVAMMAQISNNPYSTPFHESPDFLPILSAPPTVRPRLDTLVIVHHDGEVQDLAPILSQLKFLRKLINTRWTMDLAQALPPKLVELRVFGEIGAMGVKALLVARNEHSSIHVLVMEYGGWLAWWTRIGDRPVWLETAMRVWIIVKPGDANHNVKLHRRAQGCERVRNM